MGLSVYLSHSSYIWKRIIKKLPLPANRLLIEKCNKNILFILQTYVFSSNVATIPFPIFVSVPCVYRHASLKYGLPVSLSRNKKDEALVETT